MGKYFGTDGVRGVAGADLTCETVSYTHLDVYKRQPTACRSRAGSAMMPRPTMMPERFGNSASSAFSWAGDPLSLIHT